ncbi:DUF4468 domain-containing protein [Bacteroides sp. D2]|uniref:DUF4468 domain-containing protein n=1 Tax=Bacteroides sp. D2 TaxID=556259 RepID=UPI0002579DFB|nr:DUF4468 domain-containing protein [Bacteroides sp. D2]EFS31122.2 hypothetical protein BSGG_1822 [Bacteroides sp. D2]UWO00173.1 DUF4468 domain-containing protein [Bacteroides sp. D2]
MNEYIKRISFISIIEINNITKKILMILFIVVLFGLLFPIFTYAQIKINKEEFEKEYSSKLVLDKDDNLVFQKILEFPQYTKEKLYEMAKNYMDSRIQKKSVPYSTNTDYSYSNYSLIITERKNDFICFSKKIAGTCYAAIEYIYKLEIKDYRIRATIIAHRLGIAGSWGDIKDCVSNKHNKYMRRILSQFVDYTEELFAHTKKGIETPQMKMEDDW